MSLAGSRKTLLNATYLQPKFKDIVCDAEPTIVQFLRWLSTFGGIVSNIEDGDFLERFLDLFLGREAHRNATRPDFLDDEELAIPDDEEDSKLPRSETLRSEPRSTNSTATQQEPQGDGHDPGEEEEDGQLPPPNSLSEHSGLSRNESLALVSNRYSSLPISARQLDKALYHTLLTSVRGAMRDVLAPLRGNDARYTFGVIAMWKHMGFAASSRRLDAMNMMTNLEYHGNPGQWKLDFLAAVREVYASKVTIEHFMMQCAFKSFQDKHRDVQGMIAKHINDEDLVNAKMNFDKLANEYTLYLSTMATGKGTVSVNAASAAEKKCDHCGHKGHTKKECRKLKREQAAAKAKAVDVLDHLLCDVEDVVLSCEALSEARRALVCNPSDLAGTAGQLHGDVGADLHLLEQILLHHGDRTSTHTIAQTESCLRAGWSSFLCRGDSQHCCWCV